MNPSFLLTKYDQRKPVSLGISGQASIIGLQRAHFDAIDNKEARTAAVAYLPLIFRSVVRRVTKSWPCYDSKLDGYEVSLSSCMSLDLNSRGERPVWRLKALEKFEASEKPTC